MGDIVRRGTRDNPRWYARFRDHDGERKMRALPGVRTKEDARRALTLIEANVTQGRVGMEPRPDQVTRAETVMREFLDTLANRNAVKDRQRFERHVLPAFGKMTIPAAQEASEVMLWLDRLRAAGELSDGSMRACLVLLSRFWEWAMRRGRAKVNPCRMIPRGERPKRPKKTVDAPWIRDDATVWAILDQLKDPLRLAFYLGNRSGLRPGELAGLRMSDLDQLPAGAIRVRYSFDGPLKEDKDGTGKVKWVPAPADALKMLGPYLAKRETEGAGPEDVVFRYVPETGRPRKMEGWEGLTIDVIDTTWEGVRDALGLGEMTWYQSTRHSFVSRALASGAPMDEVSAAVGHSSVLVTRDAYDHFERREWGSLVRAPLKPRKKR